MSHFEPSQQRYIVMRLACHSSPKQVAKDVAVLFDLDEPPSIARIQYYDPTCGQGRDLDEELKALFRETRAAYKTAKEDLALGTQLGRLSRLQEKLDNLEKNDVLALQIIELADKIDGGFHVRRPLDGDGQNSGPGTDSLMGLPEDELDRRLAEARQRAGERASQ